MTIKVEAKSLQLALIKAAGQLGITQSDLGYSVVKESSGFWGLFGKKVEIEAWVNTRGSRGARSNRQRQDAEQGRRRDRERGRNERSSRERPRERDYDRRERESLAAEPKPSNVVKPELSAEELAALKKDLHGFCVGLIEHISGESCHVKVSEVDDRLVFAVTCESLDESLSKNMKFIEALEHLIRKKPRDLHQEMPFRIFVDINGVRHEREDQLAVMARDLSDKVFESKRPIVLNYRSSYDRKIIHMALDKDERVYTKSIGSGPNRKLMILPVRGQNQEVGAR